MLLAVITALATYIVVEQWQWAPEARRRATKMKQVIQQAAQEAQARRAGSSAQAGTSPTAGK